MNKELIILGAGAAGMMCAITAARRGRQVTILEGNESVGKKIRISGGGRCNFTNINTKDSNYVSLNPHFAKSPLARYTPRDFIKLVETYGINYHEKKLGQLFCDGSSQQIIELLKNECRQHKVEIILSCQVKQVSKDKRFSINTSKEIFECDSLVIATGALSIPSLGATDIGYKIAKHFGINVIKPFAGLVPLTLADKDLKKFKQLAGVSLDAIVSFGPISFRENILFTHKGLSGPAILQISSYWQEKRAIEINLLPSLDIKTVLVKSKQSKITLYNLLKSYLPQRLVDVLCEFYLPNKPLNQLTQEQIDQISKKLHHFTLIPSGTEGYLKAEVTVGGIDTDELSSKTMESKKIPGLYFIGEVVDVTGQLGGYNFQWAWASGHAAGEFA